MSEILVLAVSTSSVIGGLKSFELGLKSDDEPEFRFLGFWCYSDTSWSHALLQEESDAFFFYFNDILVFKTTSKSEHYRLMVDLR